MDDYMKLALEQAKLAANKGEFPVGAILVIDGKVIDSSHNCNISNMDRCSHAENTLLRNNGKAIREAAKAKLSIRLYTTLEPCLMCMGTAVLSRVTHIIYACPDPLGGAAHMDPADINSWYVSHWPQVSKGNYQKESCKLLYDYMSTHDTWKSFVPAFKALL